MVRVVQPVSALKRFPQALYWLEISFSFLIFFLSFFERESGFGFGIGKNENGYARWARKNEVKRQLKKIDPKAFISVSEMKSLRGNYVKRTVVQNKWSATLKWHFIYFSYKLKIIYYLDWQKL